MRFPVYRQLDAMDCGPTCLRMVAKFHGRSFSLPYLRDRSFVTREGVSLLGISEAAEQIGMRSLAAKVPFEVLEKDAPLPCIVHWHGNHFVVVHGIKDGKVEVADPAHGLVSYSRDEFKKGWINGAAAQGETAGVALLLEPTPAFRDDTVAEPKAGVRGFGPLLAHLAPHKKLMGQLALGFLVGSVLQLVFPFLTQSVVDFGIGHRDIHFVYAILAAQLMLFLSQTAVEMIRSWILLHVGSRVSIAIISDLLIKLMKLPVPFFESRTVGDILQRIDDHERIKQFLTSTTLNTIFGLCNFAVFGAVLLFYNAVILGVFLAFSLASVAWIVFFLRRRRELDHRTFSLRSAEQDNLVQLVAGMQEIKLQGIEKEKRWEWERIQAKLLKLSLRGLALDQYHTAGTTFFNQLKNIVVTFLAVRAVMDGQMTLGMMMSVQYIVGQLNAPVDQLIGFLHTAQDAKLSLERMQEIQAEPEDADYTAQKSGLFPESRALRLRQVSFCYGGPRSPKVLDDLSLEIPEGGVTAIVGASGSGKTTLLKLLLNFYQPSRGEILLGDMPLAGFDSRRWRERCGVVMQDGFIFSDTIARNIACGGGSIDHARLRQAAQTAHITDFVESLPLGWQTKIGEDGQALSGGQRQRLLIARAVYKNPEFIFFDEATSSLDANNEQAISESMGAFLRGRTAVIIAHRLSTVRNASQIIVLDRGRVIEHGTHGELVRRRGAYYELVRNQLELGN
jgi:ATP-binding cassette subfamily B protein